MRLRSVGEWNGGFESLVKPPAVRGENPVVLPLPLLAAISKFGQRRRGRGRSDAVATFAYRIMLNVKRLRKTIGKCDC
jgi:hypothetical protein